MCRVGCTVLFLSQSRVRGSLCVCVCVCKADACKANLCQSAWQLFRPWSCRYAPCGHKGAIDEFRAPLRRRRCTVIAFWRTFRVALIALCYQQHIHTSTADSGTCVQHAPFYHPPPHTHTQTHPNAVRCAWRFPPLAASSGPQSWPN